MKIANIGCFLLAVKACLKLGSTAEKWILPLGIVCNVMCR